MAFHIDECLVSTPTSSPSLLGLHPWVYGCLGTQAEWRDLMGRWMKDAINLKTISTFEILVPPLVLLFSILFCSINLHFIILHKILITIMIFIIIIIITTISDSSYNNCCYYYGRCYCYY